MSRSHLPLLALLLSALALCAPDSADAVDLQIGAGGKIAGNAVFTDNNNFDPPVGFGGGAQVYAAVRPFSFLSIGVNFDYMYLAHSQEDQIGDATVTTDYSFSLPSVGLLLRFLGIDNKSKDGTGWVGSFWLNYAFGSGKSEVVQPGGTLTNDNDYSGVQLGLNVLFQLRISKAFTLEVGPYLSYNIADFEIEAQSVDANGNNVTTLTEISADSLQFGLVFQGTYQLGL